MGWPIYLQSIVCACASRVRVLWFCVSVNNEGAGVNGGVSGVNSRCSAGCISDAPVCVNRRTGGGAGFAGLKSARHALYIYIYHLSCCWVVILDLT